jgi:hypothetical protein
MADFSDAEDKHLVQIALKHELAGTQISWIRVAKGMKKWKNCKEKLRLRLKALKSRFGPHIVDFPRRYLEDTPRERKRPPHASLTANRQPRYPLTVKTGVVVSSRHPALDAISLPIEPSAAQIPVDEPDVSLDAPDQFNAVDSTLVDESQHATPVPTYEINQQCDDQGKTGTLLAEFNAMFDADEFERTEDDSSALSSLCVAANICGAYVDAECYQIVAKMFQSVQRTVVRCTSGHPELNMGEVSMVGVTALLSALDIQKEDVFLDVGAGIGNVLAQVALQSRARKVLGIEVREPAVVLSRRVITAAAVHHHKLWKIKTMIGDIRNLPDMIEHTCVQESTVLYSFNTVFDYTSRVALESLSCQLSNLRLVVVADKFCPRHERRKHCLNEYCTIWKMKEEVRVNVTYSSKPVTFSIYKRQNDLDYVNNK